MSKASEVYNAMINRRLELDLDERLPDDFFKDLIEPLNKGERLSLLAFVSQDFSRITLAYQAATLNKSPKSIIALVGFVQAIQGQILSATVSAFRFREKCNLVDKLFRSIPRHLKLKLEEDAFPPTGASDEDRD
jgi:hypothetical protein